MKQTLWISPLLAASTCLGTPWLIDHPFALTLRQREIYRVAWQAGGQAIAEGKGNPKASASFARSVPPTQAPVAVGPVRAGPVTGGTASADAFAQMSAPLPGRGGVVNGFHRVGGNTNLGAQGILVSSQAFSRLGLNTGTVDGRGQIAWNPFWHTDAIGFGNDPIHFSVQDLDLDRLFETTLLDIHFETGPNTSASWINGDVNFSGLSGSLLVEMMSPFITTGTGRLEIAFSGGQIALSDDTGVFDGLLPAVGSPATFGFHIGDADGNINIGFDFGAENVNGYNFDVMLGGDGQFTEMVPEPEAVLLLALGLSGIAVLHRRRCRSTCQCFRADPSNA
jgi:hypothetical protein